MGFALSDMQLSSSNFKSGHAIPAKHTCEGEDISPSLFWQKIPKDTKSLAIICHDPDAPKIGDRGNYGFVHWVLYNLPPTLTHIEEGVKEYAHGRNDFGNLGFGGPAPPNGHGIHHYYFWILALNVEPNLPDNLDMWELLEKVEPHVLGMNRLVGTFERK